MGLRSYRWHVRIAVLVILLVTAGAFAYGMHTGRPHSFPAEAPAADNPTVITSQTEFDSDRLVAYHANGSRMISHSEYDTYWDVDPSPRGDRTVLLAASKQSDGGGDICPADSACQAVSILHLNLSTGEKNVIYTKVYPRSEATVRWHDVDRMGDGKYVVADVASDRIFVVDAQNNTVDWGWMADQSYSRSTGASGLLSDWTHLNDVEVINDTTVMVSLRNQDSVVFVHEEHGLLENKTLGRDDDYSILYEQHNPDYIPEERGGPAIVVADSMNHRVVEYEWQNGGWDRTWTWSDRRLQWPRDADRLPNGNTLVADSNGDRLLEVSPDGEVVWQVRAPSVYEAERLGTGDESANGTAAEDLGYDTRVWSGDRPLLSETMRGLLSDRLANGVRFWMPPWFGAFEVVFATLGLLALGGLVAFEAIIFPYRPTIGFHDRREESDDDDDTYRL